MARLCPSARAHRDQPSDMSSVISFTTGFAHAIISGDGHLCFHHPQQVLSPLTSPFFSSCHSPIPDSRVVRHSCHGAAFGLQNCRTDSTDAKVGSEQKKGPGAERPGWFWQGRSKEKEPMHRSILFRGAANFPFSVNSHLPPHLASFWSINRTLPSAALTLMTRVHAIGEEVGHLLAGGWKVNRRQTRFTAKAKS